MNIDIGSKIKTLRLSKSMTQEQLAKALHVSAQAVSKWENGSSLPDIQLLPALSVTLGTSIDSLFSLTDESRFARIDNMLWDKRFLTQQEFDEEEHFLQEKCREEETRPRATLLLAELYCKRAREYNDLASPLARQALALNLDCKEAHHAIFDAEHGAYLDWNATNHYRTRLTHTLEVSQIARTISRALRLNEDLTEAIALGHDLGHTPFGHAGERALNRLCPGGFSHYRQSLRVVDYLERDGQGLDLTWEVRNGIVTHTSGAWARTPEGCVVRRADHIAFLNHDIEDAITAGVLDARQLPPEAVAVLGHTKSERITTMITDLVAHSGNGKINFSPEVEAAYAVLKDFMYATVYVDKEAKREEKKVDKLISELYARLCDEPALMPNFYMQIAYNEGVDRAVTDYISGMSDEFATRLFEELFVPQKWKVL